MMRRDPVVLAWGVGLALAALVFVVGPDHFLFRVENAFHVLTWRIAEALAELSATALDVVRALSIGLFVTFIGLGVSVDRRGGRARVAIVVVSVLFLVLVGDAGPRDQSRWIAALVLSAVAASVMTSRLRHAGTLVRS